MPRLRTSPITLLQAAKKQIATEDTWCQGKLARDASGRAVSSTSPHAVRRCGVGAFLSVEKQWTLNARVAAFGALGVVASRLFHTAFPVTVNDRHGFEAVHQMYDEAIRHAKAKEGAA